MKARDRPEESNSDVFATGQGLRWAIADKKSSFDVDFTSNLGKILTVRIVCPNGNETPAQLVSTAMGRFRVHYTPSQEGRLWVFLGDCRRGYGYFGGLSTF